MDVSRNAVELLRQDHREVENLISQIEGLSRFESGVHSPDAAFLKLKENLMLHALAEEQIFYPVLKAGEATAALVPQAYRKHQQIKDLLERMSELSPKTEEFRLLLAELKTELTHHISEEENEMFVKAVQTLSAENLIELGQKIQQMKTREKLNRA
jgi:iron-sulfur cluster repair protein YtfE (RIC family)